MTYKELTLKMKIAHIKLLDSLKLEYGVDSKGAALELLLDDLLNPEPEAPAE